MAFEGRKRRILSESEAIELIEDNMTIAIGGFITGHHPMAIIRGIAKKGVKGITLIGSMSSSLEVDMLIGYDCVSKLVTAYVGAEAAVPMGPFFKRAGERGDIEIWEIDEIMMVELYWASAFGIPFAPLRGGLGTSIPELNKDIKQFTCPVSGDPLLALPSYKIDIALTHAGFADKFGNVQYAGSKFADDLLSRAADMTLTTVERIIPNSYIRRDPMKTAYTADVVVHAPYGSHPFCSHDFYIEDIPFMQEYALAAYGAVKGDDKQWEAFKSRYIEGPDDHIGYLEQLGIRRLLELPTL